MKKKKKKIEKKICVMIFQRGGGVYVPMGIFPNIIIHKNNNGHLKI